MHNEPLIYVSWATDAQGKSTWVESQAPIMPGDKVTIEDNGNLKNNRSTPITANEQPLDEKP